MLDKNRKKEAEISLKEYLKSNLLSKVKEKNLDVLNIYMKNAKESLKMAEIAKNQEVSALWTIVCSYYAMFYSANAFLYKLGYKVGDKIAHKVTADSLIVYGDEKLKSYILENYEFVEEEAKELARLKSEELIENFDLERNKRNKYQYNITEDLKNAKAKTSFERAKEFVYEIEKILLEENKK